MATFAETITKLRNEKGLKRQETADDLGISRAALEYYEKGKRKPDIEVLLRIADYYGVSADFLLGRTEASTTDRDLRYVCDYMGLSEAAVDKIRRQSHITPLDKTFEEMTDEEKQFLSLTPKLRYRPELLSLILSGSECYGIMHNLDKYLHYLELREKTYLTVIENRKNGKVTLYGQLSEQLGEASQDNIDLCLFRAQESVRKLFSDYSHDIEERIKAHIETIVDMEEVAENGKHSETQ